MNSHPWMFEESMKDYHHNMKGDTSGVSFKDSPLGKKIATLEDINAKLVRELRFYANINNYVTWNTMAISDGKTEIERDKGKRASDIIQLYEATIKRGV